MKWIFLPLFLLRAFLWEGGKIEKTDAEWLDFLGKDRFYVMRQKGTEKGFTGAYLFHFDKGIYACAACKLPLFSSKAKFESPSGWPAFKEPIFSKNVYYLEDFVLPFKRYEVLCSRCDSHLGHIFPDGPPPKNFRYTINSIALEFHLSED